LEIRKTVVPGQSGQKVSETLSQPIKPRRRRERRRRRKRKRRRRRRDKI
jgi:hypothetical protein